MSGDRLARADIERRIPPQAAWPRGLIVDSPAIATGEGHPALSTLPCGCILAMPVAALIPFAATKGSTSGGVAILEQ